MPAMHQATTSNARFVKRNPLPRDVTTANDYSTEYWFDQLIDHTNPSLGTFKQRYYFSDQYYAHDGAPIVLSTPGEQDGDGFYTDLTGASLQHAMMQVYGGAGVVLEHRYWGSSSPYPSLTAENLKYLTIDQSVEDLQYFASTVKLPWATGKVATNTNPNATPWVMLGCSYPGLLAAFSQERNPGLFAAAYATSAPVQADGDFWEYWEPIEEGMPKNCSTDVTATIAYMDNLMNTGSPADVTAMKAKFGLEALQNDDFGSALQWPLNTWQDQQPPDFHHKGTAIFYQLCDAIEGGDANAPATGVGVQNALDRWGAWYKTNGPDQDCPGTGGACYSTYNYKAANYVDTSVSDKYMRAWIWLLCTELGWFQVGDPENTSSIVSSQVGPEYNNRQCSYMFPKPDGTPGNFTGADVNDFNNENKGWNVMGNNLFVVNGQYDPWRSSSLSSAWAPKFADTPSQDINVVPNGHHCWDYYLTNTVYNEDVKIVQNEGITKIHEWLNTWYTNHPNITNAMPTLTANSAAPFGALEETINGLNNTASPSADNAAAGSSTTENEDLLDKLRSNKNLALASFIVNIVLFLLLIGALIGLWRSRKAAGFKSRGSVGGMPILPKWGGVQQGDQLGEYGSGGSAGGRGQYQTLKEQH